MYLTASSPQYAFGPGLAPAPMPMYKKGGEVKETYGLRNAAEMIRQQGRGDDTVLAHITPEEAGILKLLGGSGTINPNTGLPEYLKKFIKKIVPKPIYNLGSSIGKEIERGVESIAKDKILGPIAQMASAYFGGPIGAGIYAGLAKPGSSFDVKNAAKAAAATYAMQQVGQSMGGAQGGTGSDAFMGGVNERGGSYLAASGSAPTGVPEFIGGITERGGSYLTPEYVSVQDAVASASPITYTPSAESFVGGAPAIDSAYASTPQTTLTDAVPAPAPTAPSVNPYEIDNIGNVSESRVMGDYGYGTAPVETYSLPRAEDATGIRGLDTSGENILGAAGSLGEAAAEAAYGLASRNPLTTLSLGTTAYGAYKTKQELEDAKREADRILADQANRKKEEIEWAQSVMRDYPYNYQRLTEEDVRRERGMAMGGRITSYDDEIGGDDNMMQGGIAALAKGGLPPRYLRGGGDGMSDSIKASIEGKQEARLADGEFVVPADVVSHLGNGSSNAGAKRLYSMMDRVRRSRTGKTRQAPEVNTRRLMPA